MLNFSSLKLYAGDSWSWSESIPGKPAGSYRLKILIKQKTNNAVELTSSDEGSTFRFNINSTTTNIPSGLYNYQAKLTDLSDQSTVTIEDGTISVFANLSSSGDARSYWAVVAENLKDIYKKLSTREVTEATYNGRTFKYKDSAALLIEIQNAEIRAGIADPVPVIRERY